DLSQVEFTGADIKFMQGMIGHHAQALEMVELLKTHSRSDDMKKLALRIELSQDDEIRMMQGWLEARHQRVPSRTEMHQHGATLMPGMLTPDEMKQLAEAGGPQFDRLFLQGMIKHHGGALTMVKELLDTPGAAQEADVFAFVSDVEADQRIEIDRMGAMLAAITERRAGEPRPARSSPALSPASWRSRPRTGTAGRCRRSDRIRASDSSRACTMPVRRRGTWTRSRACRNLMASSIRTR